MRERGEPLPSSTILLTTTKWCLPFSPTPKRLLPKPKRSVHFKMRLDLFEMSLVTALKTLLLQPKVLSEPFQPLVPVTKSLSHFVLFLGKESKRIVPGTKHFFLFKMHLGLFEKFLGAVPKTLGLVLKPKPDARLEKEYLTEQKTPRSLHFCCINV